MTKCKLYSLEYYVSLGCNNSCIGCSHGAPLRSGLANVEQFERDVVNANRVLSVHRFALSGGEPLLHPKLPQMVDFLRFSHLAKEVMVLTNGRLLDRQPEAFWKCLDVLRVSRYPDQLTDEQLFEYEQRARKVGAEFMVIALEKFYKPLTRENRSDDMTLRTFQKCPYFHKCAAIYDGWYYPCSQAFFIPEIMGLDPHVDSLELETLGVGRLEAFMNQKNPLASCRRCAYQTEVPWSMTTKDRWIEESTE